MASTLPTREEALSISPIDAVRSFCAWAIDRDVHPSQVEHVLDDTIIEILRDGIAMRSKTP
jgi:hypothetical protein